jgi:hypothetical protein
MAEGHWALRSVWGENSAPKYNLTTNEASVFGTAGPSGAARHDRELRLRHRQQLVCGNARTLRLAAIGPDDAQLVNDGSGSQSEVRFRRILRGVVAAGPQLTHLRLTACGDVNAVTV